SFDSSPLKLPEDSIHRAEFERHQANVSAELSAPGRKRWNGSGLTLTHIRSSRTDGVELPQLTMRFKRSDYIRRQATRRMFAGLDDRSRDLILGTVHDGVDERYCGGFGSVISII